MFQRIYSATGNPTLQLTNAGKVTVKGFEFESGWAPTERWLLSLNVTYANSTYDRFLNATGEDYAGNHLPYAPEWKVFAGAQHTQPVSNGADLTFNLGYSFTGGQYSDASNTPAYFSDSYGLWGVNQRAGPPQMRAKA